MAPTLLNPRVRGGLSFGSLPKGSVMKTTLNVISVSLAVGMCAALLSACDGRAGSGFKSVHYTNDEIKANRKALGLDKAPNGGERIVTDGTGGGQSTAGSGAGDQVKPINRVAAPGEPNAPKGPPPVDTGTAGIQVFYEAGAAAAQTQWAGLVATGNLKLAPGAVADPLAQAIVKAISLTVTSGTSSLELKMDAQVELQGKAWNLFSAGSPIGAGVDGKVPYMPIKIAPIDGSAAPQDADVNTVIGFAFCAELNCKTVYVVLEFGTPAARVEAWFALQPANSPTEIVGQNLGGVPKTFADLSKVTEVTQAPDTASADSATTEAGSDSAQVDGTDSAAAADSSNETAAVQPPVEEASASTTDKTAAAIQPAPTPSAAKANADKSSATAKPAKPATKYPLFGHQYHNRNVPVKATASATPTAKATAAAKTAIAPQASATKAQPQVAAAFTPPAHPVSLTPASAYPQSVTSANAIATTSSGAVASRNNFVPATRSAKSAKPVEVATSKPQVQAAAKPKRYTHSPTAPSSLTPETTSSGAVASRQKTGASEQTTARAAQTPVRVAVKQPERPHTPTPASALAASTQSKTAKVEIAVSTGTDSKVKNTVVKPVVKAQSVNPADVGP